MSDIARMVEVRNTHRILAEKPEGKRPLGSPGRRAEDNSRMDVREVGLEVVDWIHPAQDRDQWRGLVNTIMNCRVS